MHSQQLQNKAFSEIFDFQNPFGMGIKTRNFVEFRDFRYSFNGKESDGETGTQDYGMRIYNPALGRFLSVDPIMGSYPWYSPYQFAGNKPIWAKDLDGLEEIYFQDVDKSKSDAVIARLSSTEVGAQIINDFRNPECNKGYNAIFVPIQNTPRVGGTSEAGLIYHVPPNDMIPNPVAGPYFLTPKELFDKLTEINDPADDDSKAIMKTLRDIYGSYIDNEDFVSTIKENKGVIVFAIDKDVIDVVNPTVPQTQKTASADVGHELGAHGLNKVQGIVLDDNLGINTDKEHANFDKTDKILNEQLNKSIKSSEGGN